VSVREAGVIAAAVVPSLLLITALVLTALALRRAGRASRATAAVAEELAVQRELLEAFGARLEAFGAEEERLRRQVANARRATFPVLRATWQFGGSPNLPVGSVDYVGGSEPALDVGVLVRWRDRDFFHTTLERVGPLTRSVPFSATGCDAAAAARLPVPDVPFKRPDAESAGLAVTWTDPDGVRRWWGQRYRFSFGFPEPDGPPLSGTAAPAAESTVLPLTGTAEPRRRVPTS
jgi:hypothetical protein